MARLIWTEPALSDLESIADYISLDNHTAAKKLVKQVFASVERLKKFPKSGRTPPELVGRRYKEVIVGPCRVFYHCSPQRIHILHVMRGEQRLRAFLLNERGKHIT